MAKALKRPQPMSSVERFFTNSSVGAALARQEEPVEESSETPREATTPVAEALDDSSAPAHPAPRTEPPADPGEPRVRRGIAVLPLHPARTIVLPIAKRTGEPIDRQREFQLTRSTDETLEELVTMYKRATGAELTRSHVLRAVLKAVAEQMPALRAEAAGVGPLRRPSNAKGFEEAREEFEEQIKEAFLRGMRPKKEAP